MFGLFESLFGSDKKQQPERITDDVFGELFYEGSAWHGGMEINLFGKTYDLDVEILSDNEAPVNADQKEACRKILGNEKLSEEIVKVLQEEFPLDEFGPLEYDPVSLCFRQNGECGLIVFIGGKDEEGLGFGVTIFPEISFFGDDESYYSMVYFW